MKYLSNDSYIKIFYNNYKKEKNDIKLQKIISSIENNIYILILLAKYAKENKITIPKLLIMIDEYPIISIFKNLTKEEVSFLIDLSMFEKIDVKDSSGYNNETINTYIKKNIKNIDKLFKEGWILHADGGYFIPTPLKDNVKSKYSLKFDDYKDIINSITTEMELLEKTIFINAYDKNIYPKFDYIHIAKNLAESFFNEENIEILNLITILAKIYGNMYYTQRALKYYKRAIKICEKILGKDGVEISKLYDNVAKLYKDSGNYQKSIDHIIKSISINKKIAGENNIESANEYNNLGECYIGINNYKKALDAMNKSLKIRKTILGDNHIDTVKTYNNIGVIYQELGDYSKALKYYQKTLKIKQTLFGKKHVETSITYNNIGVAYKYKKDYDKALQFFKKAIEIKENIAGEYSTDTATTCYNIGVLYYSKGNINEALEKLIKAAFLYRKTLGDSEITASTYVDIANIYNNNKIYKSAIILYLKAAEMYIKIDNNSELKNLYDKIVKIDAIIPNKDKNLAKTKKAENKILSFIDKVFDEYRTIPDKNHRNMANVYNMIATYYYNRGDYIVALEYYNKALNILEELASEELEKIAIANNNIGVTYNAMNKYEEAIEWFEKALVVAEEELPLLRSKIYNSIGISYIHLNKYEMAMGCFNKALEIEEKFKGTDTLEAAATYHNIGGCYRLMSNPNKAIQFLNKALSIRKNILGENNIDTAESINNIAVANTCLGEYEIAENLFIKAIKIYEEINSNHPELATLSSNLIDLYHKYIKPNNQNLTRYYKMVFEGISKKYS